MTFEDAVRARLKAGLAAAALAASVNWGVRPQGKYPAVVLTRVTAPLAQTMGGYDAWQSSRLQIDVMGLNGPAIVQLRRAVIAILAPAAVQGNVRFLRAQGITTTDLSEQTDTEFVFRDMTEITLWHLET